MSGYPTRPSRAAFGPEFAERASVRDNAKEVGKVFFNLLAWQIAGSGVVADRAWALIKYGGGSIVTLGASGECWDPNGLSVPAVAYVAPGHYTLTYPATASDETGAAITIALIAGKAYPQTASDLHAHVLLNGAGTVADIYIRNAAGTLVDADVLVEFK